MLVAGFSMPGINGKKSYINPVSRDQYPVSFANQLLSYIFKKNYSYDYIFLDIYLVPHG